MKIALITGITGQDGSYLTELLLSKGYQVHGIIRRSSSFNTGRIDHLYQDRHGNPNLVLHYGDLQDASGLSKIIHQVRPDEIYDLGAQSHVRVSFDMPEYTHDVGSTGTLRLLEIIRCLDYPVKMYFAASSECFGNAPAPQNENTPFQPRSPYAIAKCASFWNCKNYREGYKLFICNGLLFNHTSTRRGETFVSRKISKAVANIYYKNQKKLYLGNLEAKRDWGHAADYVIAMNLMLQQTEPDDYVIATGETHSVREFLEYAFSVVNLDPYNYVEVDPIYFRPTEVNELLGDATKARNKLGWSPKYTFKQIVEEMVNHELTSLSRKLIDYG